MEILWKYNGNSLEIESFLEIFLLNQLGGKLIKKIISNKLSKLLKKIKDENKNNDKNNKRNTSQQPKNVIYLDLTESEEIEINEILFSLLITNYIKK